jgi:Flp pilus assembly protein TadG
MSWRLSGRHCARRRDRGAVAVEFALVMPIVVMLLIGTITTGLSYSQALGVTNAVREGARFGATADASNGSWGSDVIVRVRGTQFDDAGGTTAICVQLVKNGAAVPGKTSCDPASAGGPTLTMPSVTAYPAVPAVPANTCVVRVIAARNYTISAVPLLPPINKTLVRGSVARYERKTC